MFLYGVVGYFDNYKIVCFLSIQIQWTIDTNELTSSKSRIRWAFDVINAILTSHKFANEAIAKWIITRAMLLS